MSTAPHPMKPPALMLPIAALMQVAMRLGLAKPLVRAFLGRNVAPTDAGKAFEGYVPSRHDVFVATFGKSGTNWMMQIAQQVAHRGEAEFAHIHDIVPWPDSPMPMRTKFEAATANPLPESGLRVIKTHLAAQDVPYSEEATYLTVIRDPKEVVVSSYHFLLGIIGATRWVSYQDWFDLMVRPEGMVGAWVRHTDSFWRGRDRANALVFTYPEIKAEPQRCIEQVAATMGVELTPSELEKVALRSSFGWMKEHESQFSPPRMPFVAEGAKMIRRGASGATDEMLSAAQQVAIDEMCLAELEREGSDFPYKTAFVQASLD